MPFKFTCRVCSKQFSNYKSLTRHRDALHSQKNKYSCGLCHESFKRRDRLNDHTGIYHSQMLLIVCDRCHGRFPTPLARKTHVCAPLHLLDQHGAVSNQKQQNSRTQLRKTYFERTKFKKELRSAPTALNPSMPSNNSFKNLHTDSAQKKEKQSSSKKSGSSPSSRICDKVRGTKIRLEEDLQRFESSWRKFPTREDRYCSEHSLEDRLDERYRSTNDLAEKDGDSRSCVPKTKKHGKKEWNMDDFWESNLDKVLFNARRLTGGKKSQD